MNRNKTLLSQKEIDALIKFLNENNRTLPNTTLSQDSIDKLIQLLKQNDTDFIKFDVNMADGKGSKEIFKLLVEFNSALDYTLTYKINPQTSRVELYAVNKEHQKELMITPKCVEMMQVVEDHRTFWGLCIEPILFDKVASIFGFKYRRKDFENICFLFAEKMYGSQDASIPSIYLPLARDLLNNLAKE